jgi:hypothetical protein
MIVIVLVTERHMILIPLQSERLSPDVGMVPEDYQEGDVLASYYAEGVDPV